MYHALLGITWHDNEEARGVPDPMPTYDFRCTDCDDRFEVVRAAGSTEDVCCPDCGAPAKRVFTPVGVVFKGSGFHNTDYKKRPKEEGPSAAPKEDAPACPAAKEGGGCSSCPAAN